MTLPSLNREADIRSLWMPRLAAAMTALVGLVNVASALTPDIRWRGELVLAFEPLRMVKVFHAVALPMGAALLLVAPYLLKRRRRALYCAMYLMLALGLVNLLKGLDFEECVLGWAVACGLWIGRGSFTIEHEPITLHSAIWRVPAIGMPAYRQLGLHSIYLGDEAIVQTPEFSLEGRAIRKVRQSVSRLRKAGYSAELHTLATISERDMSAIERVQEIGRIGRDERGFAMGMDGIHGALEGDTLFLLARDRDGDIRGMLHFVPCYGRPAVSLSMMRRDPATPNGLTEFLVVSAIEQLRERGVREVSLNFAAFSRFIRDPQSFGERVLAWGCTTLFPSFQVESLYRFNVKFLPRWDARYIVYEGKLGFPRAALASMWAEGQIPKPSVQSVQARVGQRTLTPVNR